MRRRSGRLSASCMRSTIGNPGSCQGVCPSSPSSSGPRAAAGGVGAKTAADVDVIALDLIAVLGHLHLGADEADVADVVLRAGIRAAREMDVERAVELHPGFAPVRDLLGVALGVGQSEPA